MDGYDVYRLEIAKEHNLLIDKADPALIAVTLNRIMFDKYAQLLVDKATELNTEHEKAIDASFQKTLVDLRSAYTKLVSDTGVHLNEVMRTGLIDATKDLVAKHKKDLGEAWVQIELARKTVIACAVLTVFCTIVSVGVLFKAVT